MKILVLNCGSSSIKYQLIEMPTKRVLAKGGVERIGEAEGIIKHVTDKGKQRHDEVFPTHADGLRRVFELLTDNDPIQDVSEIGAIGHRVVHGGEAVTETSLVSVEVLAGIRAAEPIDPLHVPAHVLGIEVATAMLPQVPQVCVFDTAFHQTMPKHAYLYALPYSLYTEDKIRRYGFHGTSHKFVAHRMAEILGKPIESLKIITCHLGNGASITAVDGGHSIDTSMGLTPLEGLCMGTRCGDIDPAILTYLGKTKGLDAQALDDLCNKQSGLLGLSQISNDCRVLEDLVAEGNLDAKRAMDVFNYRIVKYIGAYAMALGRVDAIVFTAGIGENSPYVRSEVCHKLGLIGVEISEIDNDVYGKECKISTSNSKVEVYVIPTNEELAIATETYDLVHR